MPKHLLFGILSCFLVITLFGSCDDRNEYTMDTNDYDAKAESIEKMELKVPEKFISVTNSDKKNLLGQTVVKMTVKNNAKMATYKDIELKLRFYSKTGTLLEEDVETVYEKLGPGQSTKFKSKFFSPKGADSVSIIVQSAQPAR